MKNWIVRLFYIGALFSSFTHSSFAGMKLGRPPEDSSEFAHADRLQNVLWVMAFISLLLPIYLFENRQKKYNAKQVVLPLEYLALHPVVSIPIIIMIIVLAAFMAVDYYSPCLPNMGFVYSYIFLGIMWLALVQPIWLYFSIAKAEKFYIIKTHSSEFYENNRAFFERWAKWLGFSVALFLALSTLASFYYMDRLNWSNCQAAR